MKDKNDILSKRIRERLENFEQPVPDHIWTAIEKDLTPVVPISRTKALWRNISVAASFLLILSLGTLFFLNHNDKGQELVERKIEKQTDNSTKTLLADNNVQETIEGQSENEVKLTNKVYTVKTQSVREQSVSPKELAIIEEPEVQTQSKTSSDIGKNKVEEKQQQSHKSSSFYEDAKANDNLLQESPRKKKKSGISYALAVGNTGNFEGGSDGVYNNGESNSFPPTHYASSMPISLVDFSKSIYSSPGDPTTPADYHYDLPVSVGFTVRKHFSNVFALETGLVYTYLASEGKVTSMIPVTNNISLNYLGIPVKAVYSLYDNKRISIYASAGGMVEKSVYGKFKSTINDKVESENLNVKELQWSVAGSVGINIKLVGHLGLFVEPGVGYYFDDGSDVMTIRKDQPLNFNLQAGLRLTY